MFKKKLLIATMSTIVAGGIASNASAVQVTESDIGQTLLAPTYAAVAGWTTDITVVNTRTDVAVKAKIVFRSQVRSVETLDFILYLSPGDVWRGTLEEVNGKATILASDDSSLNTSGNFASADEPLEKDLNTGQLEDGDTTALGHIEVVGLYVMDGDYDLDGDADTDVTVQRPMPKADVKAIVDEYGDNVGITTDFTLCQNGATSPVTPNTVSAISPCALKLMGEVTIRKDGNKQVSYRMTALGYGGYENADSTAGTEADFTSITPSEVSDGPSADAAGYLVTNAAYDETVLDVSGLGNGWAVSGDLGRVDDIERALAADAHAFAYEFNHKANAANSTNEESNTAFTATLVSFPTKYLHEGDGEDDQTSLCGNGANSGASLPADGDLDHYSAPFSDTPNGEVIYTFQSFDNEENSVEVVIEDPIFSGQTDKPVDPDAFEKEVQVHINASLFNADSGWAYYDWTPSPGCAYKGMPAIVKTYKIRGDDASATVEEASPISSNNGVPAL